jgi:dolichol kinase
MTGVHTPGAAPPPDPLAPLRAPHVLTELRRKAIHLSFVVLPLELLYQVLPWPRGRAQFRLFFIALVVGAITLDLLRLHEPRVKGFFRRFFGQMIREHEQLNLLGSTYLLLAALLAIEIFPQPVAAAALGFTVLGDAVAAIVGRAWGRHRLFNKSLEGFVACLLVCLAWAAFVTAFGRLPLGPALAGAVVASLIELLPIPLDDNLGITLFAGYAMKLLWNHG